MPDAVLADRSDRLPWLPDAPRPPRPSPQRSWVALLGSGLIGAALVAGAWAWIDLNDTPAPSPAARAPTVALAPPAPVQQAPASQAAASEAQPEPQSVAERGTLDPAAAPAVAAAAERAASRPAERQPTRTRSQRARTVGTREAAEPAARSSQEASAARAPVVAGTAAQPRALWPARQVNGAGGRLVQIGSFGSRRQAKLGWRRMQRSYPAVARLPAVVVETRNSKGRRFYRLQIGTTSHAHSEVLCQRMETIDFSCAVLGLPWKAKIER